MRTKLHFDLLEIIQIKLFRYFTNNLELDEIEKEKLELGIMVILSNLSKLLIILLISIVFGYVKQVVMMSIELTVLRLTAAGMHSKNNLICTFVSILIYVGGSYIAVEHPLSPHFAFLVSSICVVLLYRYSPADTENRPIIGEKHRKKLKIITVINSVTLIIFNLIFKNIVSFNLTMICLISETVSVLPLTYKVFNNSYNNYKKYEIG